MFISRKAYNELNQRTLNAEKDLLLIKDALGVEPVPRWSGMFILKGYKDLEEKVEFICDELGHEREEKYMPHGSYYDRKLTKLDALIKYLGIEWKQEKPEKRKEGEYKKLAKVSKTT